MKSVFRVLMLTLLPVIAGCVMLSQETGGPDAGRPTPLAAVEIREYEGQNLSSIDDFRENSIKGPQQVDMSDYRLEVTGLVSTPASYTYEEAIAFPHFSKVLTLHCVEGWEVTLLWEGIRLADLFAEVGVDASANTVIFYAHDGYSTSLPLAGVLNKNMLLAYKMNGVTLPAERGFPFQLVAEDKWGYKWIKWVTRIELSSDDDYRGFWESEGYSNSGDYGEPMFD